MDKIDVIGQVEEELTWRVEEFFFMKNQLSLISNEDKKKIYRKSLVVMLYSYYEGFCKSAFLIYTKAINQEELKRKEVNKFIQTISMHSIFISFGNENSKDARFKKELPDDKKLHKYSRQLAFIEEFGNFLEETVTIPDDVVDTESNLKPIVLKKILYRLGFPFDQIPISENTINKLLGVRNSISHGSKRLGIEKDEFEELEGEVWGLLNLIKKVIVNAILDDTFLSARTS